MDTGDGVSHTTVLIYKAYALHHAILLAGRDFTEYLMNLTERGYSFSASAEREIARDVKDNRCYTGLDCDTELKSIAAFTKQKTYALPDRSIISVGAGRFHCFEIWFQPSFIGNEARGINDTSFRSNIKCQVYIRKDLYDNVVLSSGTTIFQGMFERMTNVLTALAPSTMRSRLLLLFSMEWRIDLVYELPDGKHHHCHAEHFRCVEVLFQPSFIRRRSQRIHDTSFRSNMKRDVYIRKELYDVVLSSGTTMFREIVERITNELTALASFTTKIKVIAPIRYGLEDFSCLLSASSRCGLRRASMMNLAPHRPQLCLRIYVQQLSSSMMDCFFCFLCLLSRSVLTSL